ncbi:MAG TPA: hypothetical protein VHY08_17720 [Bacillota bacterium]|nr:hypothetical protein [Bacillota bacterium]
MSKPEVVIGILQERIDNIEEAQEHLRKKFDAIFTTLMVTLGGLVANLLLLLIKK